MTFCLTHCTSGGVTVSVVGHCWTIRSKECLVSNLSGAWKKQSVRNNQLETDQVQEKLLSSSSLILLTTGNCCEGILVASQVVLNEDVSGVYLMKETSDGGIVHQRTDGEFCTMNTRGKISGWFCCLCN